MNIFKNLLKETFAKTKDNIKSSIKSIFGDTKINFEDLEETLLKSDFGLEFTEQIINELKKTSNFNDEKDFNNSLKYLLLNKINKNNSNADLDINKLTIIQIFGVNGSGKTTTIGKLTNYYNSKGFKILIASCDTFRAAANEQLKKWATLNETKIIEDFSKDPASVAFEAVKTAKNEKYNLLFIDTAGRLHTNKNLMLELQKIDNVITKSIDENILKLNWLIVDGNSGQNANKQYEEFSKFVKIDGLIITKLDGTSKGGSVFQIAVNNNKPILFLGIGEKKDNLIKFNPEDYINSLLE
ncbi:MAG: signal recognition particle-docking protein FtsY [Stygiobacter sp.]